MRRGALAQWGHRDLSPSLHDPHAVHLPRGCTWKTLPANVLTPPVTAVRSGCGSVRPMRTLGLGPRASEQGFLVESLDFLFPLKMRRAAHIHHVTSERGLDTQPGPEPILRGKDRDPGVHNGP